MAPTLKPETEPVMVFNPWQGSWLALLGLAVMISHLGLLIANPWPSSR